jgi:hypothetical protein
MEKFKNYEKESKTKAYSKEGLLNARENAKKEDPKGEIRQWTQKMIDELKIQIDDFEMKKEAINAKKNPSAQELEHYSKSLTRHNFHLLCLEKMLRMWENDNISREEIEEIKDNVEYYVENNQEPDFIEDETIYDSFKDMLGLDGIPEEGDEFDLDLDDNSNESEDKSDDENGEKNDRKGLTTSSNTVSSTSSNNTNESIKSVRILYLKYYRTNYLRCARWTSTRQRRQRTRAARVALRRPRSPLLRRPHQPRLLLLPPQKPARIVLRIWPVHNCPRMKRRLLLLSLPRKLLPLYQLLKQLHPQPPWLKIRAKRPLPLALPLALPPSLSLKHRRSLHCHRPLPVLTR